LGMLGRKSAGTRRIDPGEGAMKTDMMCCRRSATHAQFADNRPTRGILSEATASGLKWIKVGTTKPCEGKELSNAVLTRVLKTKTEFTKQEFDALNILPTFVENLRMDDFIMSGDSYFKPAAPAEVEDKLWNVQYDKKICKPLPVVGDSKSKSKITVLDPKTERTRRSLPSEAAYRQTMLERKEEESRKKKK